MPSPVAMTTRPRRYPPPGWRPGRPAPRLDLVGQGGGLLGLVPAGGDGQALDLAAGLVGVDPVVVQGADGAWSKRI